VRGAVAFERVTFRYGPSLPDVLQEVSLTIGAGEVVALVGPSGAGKTTIASLVPRFWDVTDGRVTLDGHDVRTLSFAAVSPVLFQRLGGGGSLVEQAEAVAQEAPTGPVFVGLKGGLAVLIDALIDDLERTGRP
jgi:ABC-type ATPase involved in cell division